MNRREFSLTLAGAASLSAATLWTPAARAQGATPVEGQQYTRVSPPIPVEVAGKIEVIEFFWYGCPHCNEFEPMLEAWVAKLPADVHFRRVHVAFTGLQRIHQRLWCTLDVMGLIGTLQAKVFQRFHDEHRPLNSLEDAMAWAASQGVDPQKFSAVWNSFSVPTRMAQATALVQAYAIDGVPTLAVDGRYLASPISPGQPGQAQCLAVVDWLLDQVRHGH